MSQILHIFRKDVRHFWIEILVSLALVTAYTWTTIHGSISEDVPGISAVLRAIPALVPTSWCFLIVRAVQDEALVGDRQAWITRPYQWRKLLAAKFLFAGTFVSLPLFGTGLILLGKAGFSPLHHLGGLLWIQGMFVLALIAPSVALGAIASNFVRALLWVLGVGLYALGIAFISNFITASDMPVANDVGGDIAGALLTGLSVAIVFFQYSRRQVQVSRFLILGVGAALPIVLVATPYAQLVKKSFPLVETGEVPPARLEMLELVTSPSTAVEPPLPSKEVDLNFPLGASGVAPGSVVVEEGTLTTIQGPGGRFWSSGWERTFAEVWPGQPRASVTVSVPQRFFESVRSSAVDVHLSIAMTLYRETNSRTIVAQPGMFPVPGVGTCWIDLQRAWDNSAISCHSPLNSPSLVAHMESGDSTCPPSEGISAVPEVTKYSWNGSDDDSPAEFAINPVRYFTISLESWVDQNRRTTSPGVCPGTPVVVATPEIAQHARVQTELDGIRLHDYELRFDRF